MLLAALLAACGTENQLTDGSNGDDTTTTITDPDLIDSDYDGVVDADDCEPHDNDIHPGAGERCNEIDDDCDGKVDEGFDEDDDGFMDVRACFQLQGTWDCDDGDAEVNPDAEEICDGKDDDCDGNTDDVDDDHDGIGLCDEDCDDEDPFVYPGAAEACDGVDDDCDGQVDEIWDGDGDGHSGCDGDCDDEDPEIGPDAAEHCDGIDENCDGRIDETFDLDADGVTTCTGDCDDGDADVYPDHAEVCDGKDNDCDAATDENADVDADGYSICAGDCDDAAASAYPSASESCDGVDNDCNGYFDEMESCWSCTTSGSYMLCATATDWDSARQACEGMGWYLVNIGSSGENTDVASLAQRTSWIGATDAATEGTWLWTDGSTVYYDAWASGEPDDAGDSDCAETNQGGWRGQWADMRCTTDLQFVCEM
jgi:hypothetical protein